MRNAGGFCSTSTAAVLFVLVLSVVHVHVSVVQCMEPGETGSVHHEGHDDIGSIHSEGDEGDDHLGSATGSTEQERSFEMTKLSKEEQLALYEEDIDDIRRNEVQPAVAKVARLTSVYREAKQSAGWIPSSAAKQRIYALEQELNSATHALVQAQQREIELHSRMKPLYGIVSYEFMREQQATIQGALKKVNDMAFQNAMWDSMLNARAESFTDLIVQFFLSWFLSYVVMYPFAVLYYALWAAPWSIYSFSSGYVDIVSAFLAWCTSVLVLMLPLVVLIVSGYFIMNKYGPEWQRQAEERARQREQQQREHFQRMQRIQYGARY